MSYCDIKVCLQVYTYTFGNKPYLMSIRENIEVTTPELSDYENKYSDFTTRADDRLYKRISKEKAI